MMTRAWVAALVAATISCKGKGGDSASREPQVGADGDKKVHGAQWANEGSAAREDTKNAGMAGGYSSGGANDPNPGDATTPAPAAAAKAPDKPDDKPKTADAENGKGRGGDKPAETVTRAWFPETFLFEPLVVTDAHGEAVVPVRVPDRLTTWRVLALAHSRTGQQAGAVASFLGTLPTYVDPIVPKHLVIGDRVRLPVQLVNTTTGAVAGALSLGVEGASLATGAGGARTIPAGSSLVDYAELDANRAGDAKLRAQFAATTATAAGDAVIRSIEVEPAGRPVDLARSGTLAAPRTLHIRPSAPIRRPIACGCSRSRVRSRCCAPSLRRRRRAAARATTRTRCCSPVARRSC